MHELPVINSILKVVLKHAAAHNVSKVMAVHLEVGELSDLEDKWMQQYFEHLAKDSVAQGAVLKIERTPVVMECLECGRSYEINLKEDPSQDCPDCKSGKVKLISGKNYMIKNLEAI